MFNSLVGGEKPNGMDEGCYVQPTLIEGVKTDMRIGQEEVFGPFLSVFKFKTEEEAVAIANSVDYGLTAYIWTKDIGRAHRIARDVESGMVWINSQNVRHLPTPFGGVKNSGIGTKVRPSLAAAKSHIIHSEQLSIYKPMHLAFCSLKLFSTFLESIFN